MRVVVRFGSLAASMRPLTHRVSGAANVARSRLSGIRWPAALSVVTPLGWLVLVGSIAAWLLGWRLGWIELILAAATGLLTFGLCSLFALGRVSSQVTLELAPPRLVAGGHATVTVEVTARQRSLPVVLEVTVGDSVERFHLPGLPAGGTHRETFDVPAPRRGVIPVGPATTVRADPLGLLRRTVSWSDVKELFVYPVTVPLGPIGSGLLRDLEGQTTNDVSMSDLAFHALREYAPGDDRRYIHWRSSAKVGSSVPGGKFLVRQFRDTRRTHLLVIVDGDPGAYTDSDDLETAISVGASVAVRAVDDDLEATVIVADQVVHKATRQRALDACARAMPARTGLSQLVARGTRVAPEATAAVIVTGAEPTFAALRKVAAQLPAEVRTIVLQVDPAARPRLATGAALKVVVLSELGNLRAFLMGGDAA